MDTSYDAVADAAYVKLGGGLAVETVSVNDLVNVDLDESGGVIGFEILSASQQFDPSSLGRVSFTELDSASEKVLTLTEIPAAARSVEAA